ncbi:hypothetical protein Tco_0352043 [Tanacetum coccineum]
MCDRIGCSKQYEKSKASIILSGSSWNRLLWKDHVAANQGRSQVAFRRNTFSIRNLEGFELLKGNRNNKSYTSISLKLAYATPICLMNVLLYQVLQGKSKKASHPPKPVPNSKQRLHLLHMDLCGLIRVEIINGKRALCYPKNDHEDIGKLGAKGDIGFFIGYSANLCAYRVYNRRTKKIMETMNVTFDELSAMAFE